MNYRVCTAGTVAASLAGTYDFSSSAAQVKAIDQAMRNYFGTDHWLVTRNRLFPGLQSKG
jgi:hypothetical protein